MAVLSAHECKFDMDDVEVENRLQAIVSRALERPGPHFVIDFNPLRGLSHFSPGVIAQLKRCLCWNLRPTFLLM